MAAHEPQIDGLPLLLTVFVAAVCGLVYELLAGTLSSYLLGDSVTQFSLVIGLFLTSMGIGSYLSKFIQDHLIERLIKIEFSVGVIGGSMAAVGFAAFAYTSAYSAILIGLVLLIGVLVGMEIPIVIRILRDSRQLDVTLAQVMSLDYIGALLASLAFPFLILPELGLVRGGFLVGLLNVLIGLYLLYKVVNPTYAMRQLRAVGWFLSASMAVGIFGAERATQHFEDELYQDEIIFAKSTQFQRVIVTRWRDDFRLYLNGHLQFSSTDEYRYHEALVHPAMLSPGPRSKVLILGGGDGMAAREVLSFDSVKTVTLVDLDDAVTALFRDHELLATLNNQALSDNRIQIINRDAMSYLETTDDIFDVVIIDLPDPSDTQLGKLYSKAFYDLVQRRLSPEGRLGIQATSPYRAREAFWSIVHTVEASTSGNPEAPLSLQVYPYHTMIPSFGTWGFILASRKPLKPTELQAAPRARYLNNDILPGLFKFPSDMARVPSPVSSLNNPVVVTLYRDGYHQYFD